MSICKQLSLNSRFASGGVIRHKADRLCKLGVLCPPQADSVQVDSFVPALPAGRLRNQPEHKASKSWRQCYLTEPF